MTKQSPFLQHRFRPRRGANGPEPAVERGLLAHLHSLSPPQRLPFRHPLLLTRHGSPIQTRPKIWNLFAPSENHRRRNRSDNRRGKASVGGAVVTVAFRRPHNGGPVRLVPKPSVTHVGFGLNRVGSCPNTDLRAALPFQAKSIQIIIGRFWRCVAKRRRVGRSPAWLRPFKVFDKLTVIRKSRSEPGPKRPCSFSVRVYIQWWVAVGLTF